MVKVNYINANYRLVTTASDFFLSNQLNVYIYGTITVNYQYF